MTAPDSVDLAPGWDELTSGWEELMSEKAELAPRESGHWMPRPYHGRHRKTAGGLGMHEVLVR